MTKTKSKSNGSKVKEYSHDHAKDAYDAAEKAGRAAYETELAARSPVGVTLASKYGSKGAKKAAKKSASRKASRKR